jgi:DNA-binding ferritin-like protein
VTTASQLDECAERIVALESNGGSRAGRCERMRAKERIGAHKYDVTGE